MKKKTFLENKLPSILTKFSKKRYMLVALLAALVVLSGVIVFSLVLSLQNQGFSSARSVFYQKLSALCWVSYAPTHFNPKKGLYPSKETIREDLKVLYNSGFRGIVTYGSEKSLKNIPKIAKEEGFSGIIMGVWDPASPEEFKNALDAVKYVDGYTIGHIGLNDRYSLVELKQSMKILRKNTKKPVSTTERIGEYFQEKNQLLRLGDWLFPDVSLYWEEERKPKEAYNWLVEQYLKLTSKTDKPVLLKTVGFPSAGGPQMNQSLQAEFFRLILRNAEYKEESLRSTLERVSSYRT